MKVGFIGTGNIFDLHVEGYLENKDIDIVALCDNSLDNAESKAKEFNLRKSVEIYSDYKNMMVSENLDLVEILLPTPLHAEVIKYICQSDIKAISVDSPMTSTLKEAEQVLHACNDNGVMLSVYENFYFAPHIQKAKELIENDYIGEPVSIRIKIAVSYKNGWELQKRKTEKNNFLLFEIGWDAFALARLFFKEKIRRVFAWSGEYKGITSPAYVMFQYEQTEKHTVPPYGNFELSLLPEMNIPSAYYPIDEFIEIIGTRGLMKINQGTSIGNVMTDSEVFSPLVIVRDGKVEKYNEFPNDLKQSYINATQHLINAIKGDAEPILDGQIAKQILEFNLAALQSSQEGREVYLSQK